MSLPPLAAANIYPNSNTTRACAFCCRRMSPIAFFRLSLAPHHHHHHHHCCCCNPYGVVGGFRGVQQGSWGFFGGRSFDERCLDTPSTRSIESTTRKGETHTTALPLSRRVRSISASSSFTCNSHTRTRTRTHSRWLAERTRHRCSSRMTWIISLLQHPSRPSVVPPTACGDGYTSSLSRCCWAGQSTGAGTRERENDDDDCVLARGSGGGLRGAHTIIAGAAAIHTSYPINL